MLESAVSFAGLGHSYQSGQWVFRDYGADIPHGSIFSILGPNGRGKTTLLRAVLGTLTPSVGRVRALGRMAFVPQIFQVSFDYSALDMVLMGRVQHVRLFSQPSRRDEAAALAALDRFGLAALASRPFHRLSGGERQLVMLARALVAEPDILVLDEPTSALDLKNQSLILTCLHQLSKRDRLTILFTTHHPHHALAIADRVLLMMSPERCIAGPAEEVLTEANLLALYDVPLKRFTFCHEGMAVSTFAPVLNCTAPRSRE